jgi:hypothetical protein
MRSEDKPVCKKRIKIDDSDCDGMGGMTTTAADVTASSVAMAAPVTHEPSTLTADVVATVENTTALHVPGPSPSARQKMHLFFASFKGCNPNVLEIEPVAAADAELMDLRRVLPFQPLESAHVGVDSDDTSGHTYSESECDDDMSDFIDDAQVDLTPDDMIFISEYGAQEFPITAAVLINGDKAQNSTTILLRRNRIVLSSDSSSSSSPTNTTQDADGLPELSTYPFQYRSGAAAIECPVCLELLNAGEIVRALPCCHSFHIDCIDPWLSSHHTCPVCKHDLLRQASA